MTLAEQSSILIEAIEDELLQPEDIVRWADNIIVSMEKPPTWIIDLSTLGSPHMVEYVSRLRKQTSASPPLRRRIQIVVLAHEAGLLSLRSTLSKLFGVMILKRLEQLNDPLDGLEDRLHGALVDWDCQDDLDVIEPPLQDKLTALFREYLMNADGIAEIVPWKFLSTRSNPP
jgi:hypothetical protein